jgi:glycosyltransferase involved in cell wall biosynthesis
MATEISSELQLDASIAYPEASTIHLTRALGSRGLLGTVYAPALLGRVSRRLNRPDRQVPAIQSIGRAARWDFEAAVDARVEDAGSLAMVVSAVLRRLPRVERLATRANYAAKHEFDRSVARARNGSNHGVLGIQGSSAATFLRGQPGAIRVLNHVNGHPEVHNERLRELAGLAPDHPEMIPRSVMRRAATESRVADLVIVPSNGVLGQLVGRGLDAGRIVVVPYGVDTDQFRPPAERLPEKQLKCLYVGQISHRKGIRFLCAAARRMPAIKFDLVGPMVSPEVLRAAPANVNWRGVFAHGDLARSFGAYDIFVLPSLEDSYGLVATEAAASGLPVVISDAAGASEVLSIGGAASVVAAGSARALSDAIEQLADDPRHRAALGGQGRAIAMTLTWERFCDRVVDAIQAEPMSELRNADQA